MIYFSLFTITIKKFFKIIIYLITIHRFIQKQCRLLELFTQLIEENVHVKLINKYYYSFLIIKFSKVLEIQAVCGGKFVCSYCKLNHVNTSKMILTKHNNLWVLAIFSTGNLSLRPSGVIYRHGWSWWHHWWYAYGSVSKSCSNLCTRRQAKIFHMIYNMYACSRN